VRIAMPSGCHYGSYAFLVRLMLDSGVLQTLYRA
jgi:hypothetical protein